MKDMTNPPEGFEDAYKALEDMYQAYLTFTNTVLNCKGSLQSFSDEYNSVDKALSDCYNAAELYTR